MQQTRAALVAWLFRTTGDLIIGRQFGIKLAKLFRGDKLPSVSLKSKNRVRILAWQQLNPSEISEISKKRIENLDSLLDAQNGGHQFSVSRRYLLVHGWQML